MAMNKNKGFNIIEVAMSIMIVSVAIVMIIGIYTNIIKAQTRGIGKTVASSIAERVMQDIANNQLPTIKAKIKQNVATQDYKYELTGKDIVNDNIYYYHAKIYPIGGTYFDNTNILQLDVIVFYDIGNDITEQQIKTLTEAKNSVKFSRLITFSEDD